MNKLSVNKFSSGFKFIFKGFEAIKSDKTLWKWALIPLVLDLILLIYVLASAFAAIGATVNWGLSFIFTSTTGFFYNLLYYPLYILFFISVGAIAIYSVYLIGSIIASPFNSMIAEKVLINRGLLKQQNFNFKRWLAMSLKMFFASLLRAGVFIFIGIGLFVFSFIPGFNFVTSFVVFVIIAFDNMDYSYEAVGLGLSSRFKNLKVNAFEYSGMGTVIGLTLFIPGLTLLLMPFMVAGAAAVYNPGEEVISEPRKLT